MLVFSRVRCQYDVRSNMPIFNTIHLNSRDAIDMLSHTRGSSHRTDNQTKFCIEFCFCFDVARDYLYMNNAPSLWTRTCRAHSHTHKVLVVSNWDCWTVTRRIRRDNCSTEWSIGCRALRILNVFRQHVHFIYEFFGYWTRLHSKLKRNIVLEIKCNNIAPSKTTAQWWWN